MSRATRTLAAETLPCPFIAGDMEMCARPRGHRGRHKPGQPGELPEISGRKLARIGRRFDLTAPGPLPWWRLKARCPACRTVIAGLSLGVPIGPVMVTTCGGKGPCVEVISEYPVRFDPCGHEFRRVTRPKDIR